MGFGTKIDYAHATWSPWIGCSECSPGCTHCYARDWAKRFPRFRGHWGEDAPRYFFADSHWKQPLAWNRKAQREGTRYRVLVSLCDPFERLPDDHPLSYELVKARRRLWQLIRATSFLDWLLPTKRPESLRRQLPYGHVHMDPNGGMENLWLGVSVEKKPQIERIKQLRRVPAAVRWVSYEPALGPLGDVDWSGIGWVVIGCETGPRARPMELAWADSVVAQCKAASVPVFTKQLRAQGKVLRSADLDGMYPMQYPEVRQ